MCPLRIILIFLSATLAGFFVLRNLKNQSEHLSLAQEEPKREPADSDEPQLPKSSTFSKVCSAMESGFWTCVDMASGRYLWRHLVSSTSNSELKRSV